MTCLRKLSCLLYLLLTLCCGRCLDRLEPLGYGLDDDTQDGFQWNEENRKTYFQVSKGHNISRMINQEQPGLQANGKKSRMRRSCELPDAAFVFKQIVIPESDVKTFTAVCKEPDMMDMLQFQGKKETFRRGSGLSEYGNSEESVDDNGIIFKEAIGFEVPENSNGISKGQSFPKRNMATGIEHRAKSRLSHDIRSNGAKVIQDILARVQSVEKLKGRARREIRYRKFRATPKPRWDSFETSLEKTRAISNDQGSAPKKRPKEKLTKSNRPWQEKLWDNIRRSSIAHQKLSPVSSATTTTSYPWKFLHIKSRSVTIATTILNHSAKYGFRRYFSLNRSAESQPRAMHLDQKHCGPTKSNARPRKGHNCHYHYKNHRIREQQAFHRLKSNTQQLRRTPGSPDGESSTSQALDEDAIMSTLGMDLSGPTQQDVKPATTKTPKTTMPTYPVWTHFQHVQTTVPETTVSPQTFATTVTASERTTDTPKTESPTTTSAPTQQIETTTPTRLTTYLTTINMDFMTGLELTAGTTIKAVDVKDDESATANVPSEADTTITNYVHRKRFRKT